MLSEVRYSTLTRYGLALLTVSLALVLTLGLDSLIDMGKSPFLLFFAAIMVSAWFGGVFPGLVATCLSGLLSIYLFIPLWQPEGMLWGELVRVVLFMVEGTVISLLNAAHQRVNWSLKQVQHELKGQLENQSVELTERQRIEVSLRQSERRFQRLIEANVFGFALGDFKGTIHYANDAFLRMIGYSHDEILTGKVNWDAITPVEFLPLDEQAAHELKVSGIATPFEKEYIHKDGRRIPILIAGVLLEEPYDQQQEIATFYVDLSDRKRAEEALQETNQTLEALIQACPLAITVFDLDGTVQMWNPAAEKIFGWTEAEAMGQFLPCIPEQKRSEFLANLEIIRQGRSLSGVEAHRQKKTGEMIDIGLWAAPLRDAKGTIRCMSILADISDRKRAEAERAQLLAREKAARAEAETANRMKDEFLATLSHELRTPINVIMGWTQMLRNRQLDPTIMSRALEAVDRNSHLLSRLIEDLLDVSRIVTGKLQLKLNQVNLPAVIESAIDTVTPAAVSKEIQIACHLESIPYILAGDADRLQQVLWNLLSNAVKFTPPGGQIDVRLSLVTGPLLLDEREQTQDTAHLTYYAQIQVRDTGKGIEPDFLPYVFDRFRQADSSLTRSYGGLGLGMAIVRHLVELHGGTVQADSPGEGQGATFTVRLPLYRDQRLNRLNPPNPSFAPSVHRLEPPTLPADITLATMRERSEEISM